MRTANASSLPQTRPLPQASLAFAPLPEGALLNQGRYTVLEARTLNGRLNSYRVEDNVAVRSCPNCRFAVTDAQERACPFCRADLSGVPATHARYRVLESGDEHAFAAEAQWLDMGLDHPGLLPPLAVFSEAPYGPVRHYRVEPELPPVTADALPVPQELATVLEWGVALARALHFLHRHHIALREVRLDHIVVDGREARWLLQDVVTALPPEEDEGRDRPDVRELAALLFYLATGQAERDPQALLPEAVVRTFAQVLSAPYVVDDADRLGMALEVALYDLRRPASVTLSVGRRTDVGQQRRLNEDSLLTLHFAAVFRSVSVPVGVFAVADGMGGHTAGDLASQLAIRAIAQQAVHDLLSPAAAGDPLPDARRWLVAAVQAANQAVHEQRITADTDMGTTLTLTLVVGDQVTIANVGDSRAYWLGPEGIVQLTTDHSFVERLVATGQITRDEAARHPQRNVIYRVIGDRPQVEADLFEHQLAPGEALLLCSDGLNGMLGDEQIAHIWRTSVSPQEACDRLVEAANEAGGEDNISVIVVQRKP